MKDTIIKIAVGIIIGIAIFVLLFTPTCKHNETNTLTTKKQGKTELVKSKEIITFDTLRWIASYKANTKPVIKWIKPKSNNNMLIDSLLNKISESESNKHYSPCDSIFASSDTGSIEGVKFAIVDTISDNRVIGRSINLEVPQAQITKQVLKVNDSLRVDTVYVNQKQKFGTNAKWFLKGFGLGNFTGFIGSSFVPK